jgi:hypothetical protein
MRNFCSVGVLVSCLALAGAAGSQAKSKPVGDNEATCHGTAVNFVDTPSEAAKLAKKQEKLVFVLHVSGHFEDPTIT